MRVKQRVSLVDIMPTVLAEVGLAPELPYELPGEDLGETSELANPGVDRRIYGEVSRWDSNDLDLVGVIDEDGYKRVLDISVPPRENAPERSLGLWNTRADPKEEFDLSPTLPVRAAYGEQLLARWLLLQRDWCGRRDEKPAPGISEDLQRELRALGYLGARPPGDDAARDGDPR
jgi:arylsulfatase A-like enzyme